MHTDSTNFGNAAPRSSLGLNHGWEFQRALVPRQWLRDFDGTADQSVDLPHCWNETDTFQVGTRYYQGPGAYRRTFTIPDGEWRDDGVRWVLEAEGFYGTGDVWLNGRLIQRINGQYLGFSMDVTSALRGPGPHRLAISLTNVYRRFVLPGKKMPDFLLHGGLAGRVFLRRIPDIHIHEHSLRIRTDDVLSECARVRASMAVRDGSREKREWSARCSLLAADGAVVCVSEKTATSPTHARAQTVDFDMDLADPQRWSLTTPTLYTARMEVLCDGHVEDRWSTRFGIREAEFRGPDGFFLNGERVALHGANRHESIPGFGNALPESLHVADAELLKRLGFNFVRLSHYPEHPAFLDACDELGILVYAEIATWKSVRPGPWGWAAVAQMRKMVLRDRNHPSVILWGMGNESRSSIVYGRLVTLLRKLDPDRSTTYAENHLHRGIRWRTLKIPDVLGVNYELTKLEEARDRSRTGAIIVSECSNCPRTYRGDVETEIDQVERFERDLAHTDDKPFVAGYALWCFNDYGTQRKQRFQRHPGVVDAWRVPKMSAAYIQARALTVPFVRVFADWGEENSESQRRVDIFTNCSDIKVMKNGRLTAELKGETHIVHETDFAPGVLTVVGSGAHEDISDALHSHGKGVRIALSPDCESVASFDRPTVGIELTVLDRAGHRVLDWNEDLDVDVEGPARGRYYRPSTHVCVAAGTGRFFVTGTGVPGHVIVRVTHPRLGVSETSIDICATDASAHGAMLELAP